VAEHIDFSAIPPRIKTVPAIVAHGRMSLRPRAFVRAPGIGRVWRFETFQLVPDTEAEPLFAGNPSAIASRRPGHLTPVLSTPVGDPAR
jgi:hypothetical protein